MSLRKLRCAIYTRKSSEEGLEQSFNSLHAQRDACEAYVRSQNGEGWSLIRTAYDDGGFSGGNLERPALKALLADVEAGRIDVVVVYKVDRLTRSLTDFARIVEAFDAKSVSFVSVTQAFNTTSSMGRLTLNVLLSFAQFEREVTGERIRDKIAASKARGMWMGGNPALGYDIADRRLVINEAEAEAVRHIFQRYLEVGGVSELVVDLARKGVRSKCWVSANGIQRGGLPINRGALFHTLKNRLYVGDVVHKGTIYKGEHPPIVSHELFEAVQGKLSAQAVALKHQARSAPAPLKGLIFDQDGCSMSSTVAYGRHGKAFRYYVSASLQQGVHRPTADEAVRRVSAPQLEALMQERLARLGLVGGWPELTGIIARVELRAHALHILLRADRLMSSYPGPKAAVAALQQRLPDGDAIGIDASGSLNLTVAMRPVFRGGRTWLVHPATGRVAKPGLDKQLVEALKRAHQWQDEYRCVPMAKLEVLRTAASPDSSYIRKAMQLALLAPDIQRAILEGRQPAGLSLQQVLERGVPLAWPDQRDRFGFPNPA
ncbi:recombinase family protein [Phenylobacterium sp.]|uniref:recombinase family protein n=1 Tax=Phenylobacterium sp. TaxID=1871053 RepID=UPI0025DA71E2|nr:recombinase family protein [Phenylobacterium sp.]MCA3714703.1 recombinase family protein [Phenylobacterium sp.]